jgi:hypothetical protein
MSAEFDVEVVIRNGRTRVFMGGEIDLTTSQQVREALVTAQQGAQT